MAIQQASRPIWITSDGREFYEEHEAIEAEALSDAGKRIDAFMETLGARVA